MTETTLYQVEDGWIETYTGQQFHFANPQPSEIHIEDIAHALSLLCRYNGHTKRFYSVAEHSILISQWLLFNGYEDLALTGLLHDGAEAYIGDMPRPIKVTMPEFKRLEERIDRAVSLRFGTAYPFPPIVKELDTRILVDERKQVMNPSPNKWGTDDLEGISVEMDLWQPQDVEKIFLYTYRMLTEDRK